MTSKFIASGQNNPCPACGRTKDKDCRSKESGNLVLCHTLQDQLSQANPGYKFIRKSDEGAGYGVWIWEGEKPLKPAKPKRKIETPIFYPNRDGTPFIKVTRIDKANSEKDFFQHHWDGSQFISGMAEDRADVPIYQYEKVRQAIADGKPIYWCEGEKAADALWSIGLAATTSIGGSKAYRNYGTHYRTDLDGATVILCPDRDEEGLSYIKEVAKDFPSAKYCKVFPKSPLWGHIPKNGGLDIADWIGEGATAEEIQKAICDRLFEEPETEATPAYNAFLAKVDEIYQTYQGNEREFYLEELARANRRTVAATKAYYRGWQNQGIDRLPVTEGLDFLAEPVPTESWLIANLLPLGSTILLTASPGAGKTTLAYSLAHAVISGEDFSGRPVQQGKVLILQGDDSRTRTHRLLSSLGFGDLPKDSWYLYRGFDFTQMDHLDDFVAKHGITLVLCDSYSKLNAFSPYEEKDEGYADPISELSKIADKRNCSFLMIHHLNKAGQTRGHTAIEANCDEVWLLKKEENKPIRTFIHGKSRADTKGTYLLEYDEDSRQVSLADINTEPASTGDRIRVWLGRNPNIWYEAIEVANEPMVGQSSVKAVFKALLRLAEKGYISQEKRTRQGQTGDREYSVFCLKRRESVAAVLAQADAYEDLAREDSSESYGF